MKAAVGVKSTIQKILICNTCSKGYISNRKKKCCGQDLEECGHMETTLRSISEIE